MSSRLDRIAYWAAQARAEHCCVQVLARKAAISISTFERDVRKEFNLFPKVWLLELKMQRACELLLKGLDLKEVARERDYGRCHHFSRDFTRDHGYSLTEFVALHWDEIHTAIRRAAGSQKA